MKIATRAAAALLLAVALAVPAAAAHADDDATATPDTTAAAPADDATPAVADEPEAAPAPEPTQEAAVAPDAAPAAQSDPEPVLAPQEAAQAPELAKTKPQPELFDGWVTWLAPNYVPVNPSLSAIGLPQSFVGLGKLTPETCEQTYQQDHYVGTKAAVDAILADGKLGGTVQHPEDSAVVTEWAFVSSATCPPPPPAPVVCTPTGSWYTEDIAPTVTQDGLLFTGSTPHPVNWLHPVTGNFQGFTGASYILADVAGYQTAYRFVVNPNAGTLHYASVTVEPYLNGWTAGQSGTFTITPASLAWSSKIPTGPGSQSQPVPLSSFGTIWPDNALISVGFHLGSTNDASTHSVVTGVTGCLSVGFVPLKGEPRVTTEIWTDSTCTDPLDGTTVVTTYGQDTTYPLVFTDGQWVEGEPVVGDVYVIGTQDQDDETCAPEPTPTPTPTETPTPTVTPTPTDTPTVVVQTITPAAPQSALAHTGANGTAVLGISALLLVLFGALGALAHRARRSS